MGSSAPLAIASPQPQVADRQDGSAPPTDAQHAPGEVDQIVTLRSGRLTARDTPPSGFGIDTVRLRGPATSVLMEQLPEKRYTQLYDGPSRRLPDQATNHHHDASALSVADRLRSTAASTARNSDVVVLAHG